MFKSLIKTTLTAALCFYFLGLTDVTTVAANPVTHTQDGDAETTKAYLKRLGLGTQITVLFVFSVDDPGSTKAIPFYKRLAAIPGLDKVKGRLIALTHDGLVPAKDLLQREGLTVHRFGSFPEYSGGIPDKAGSIALLDSNGKLLKTWAGFPTAAQQNEIISMIQGALK